MLIQSGSYLCLIHTIPQVSNVKDKQNPRDETADYNSSSESLSGKNKRLKKEDHIITEKTDDVISSMERSDPRP